MTSPPPARTSRLTAERLLELGPVLVVVAATILCAWIFSHVFAGEINGDDNTFHLAEAARLRDCLIHHDWDFWNPNANLGYASGYYYQLIPQLVPALGSAVLGGSILFWFQLGVFVPLVLIPAATYRAMRVLGATPWQSAAAAVLTPLIVSTSKWGFGADGTFVVGLYTQTWASVAFPLALAYGARWIDERRGLGAAAFWGIFVGLCHPFAGVAVGVALAAGEVGRAVIRGGRALAASKIGRAVKRGLHTVSEVVAASMIGRAVGRGLRAFGLTAPAAEVTLPAPDDDGPRPLGAFGRLCLLGALLLAGSASAWLPVLVDYVGFGGFPHRVGGEDGLGFAGLLHYVSRGDLLDAHRIPVVTYALPVIAVMVRAKWLPRLWSGAIAFALFLAVGPHLKTQDDLFPAIRFLGWLQVVLGMIAGAGAVALVREGWRAAGGHRYEIALRGVLGAAAGAAAGVVIAFGAGAQHGRIAVASDFTGVYRAELGRVIDAMADADQGRKQALAGATSHFANQLPYVYARRDAMLQMGGAGLQASPNYVYLWEQQDAARSAWIYDAPLVLYKIDQATKIKGGEVVMKTPHYGLKKFPAPGLVSPVQVVGTLPPGRKAARARARVWLHSERPMKNQVLAYDGSGGEGPAPQGIVIAYSRQPSPGDEPDITAEVEASAPTTFEVLESWHPRWHAFVDGKPAAVRRVTPDVLAVDVGPGRHHLAFRFDRPWWAWALWLLWPGAALLGWAITRYWITARTPAAPA